jgi:acyl dehydratase
MRGSRSILRRLDGRNSPEERMMVEPLRYDSVRLHEPIGPFSYVVPADFNEKRLPSLSIDDPGYFADRDGRHYAEPSFLCGQHSWVVRQRYSWGGSVHAKCDVQFLKPVYPGATIHVGAEVVGKYERRGGHYVVFQVETRDDQGGVVSRVQNTMLLNLREVLTYRKQVAGQPREAERRSDAPPARSSRPDLLVSFGPKTLRRDDILRFFRAEEEVYGVHPCIHNDEAIAKAAGLADIVAPGRYLIGLMNCMFAMIYGTQWLQRGRYSVSFLNNLLPGIVAHVRAGVPSAAGSAVTARTFGVTCHDDASGKALLSGTAGLD